LRAQKIKKDLCKTPGENSEKPGPIGGGVGRVISMLVFFFLSFGLGDMLLVRCA